MMMRDALFIARTDFLRMFRSRETWVWAFIMPIIFLYFFGTISGGSAGSSEAKEVIAVSAAPDAGFLVEHLVGRLEARNYRVVRVRNQEEFLRHHRRLTIPSGFTDSVLAGKPVKIGFERSGGGMDSDYDNIRVARAVYAVLADVIVLGKDGSKPAAEDFSRLAQQPRSLTLEVNSAGRRKQIPSRFEHSVPGSLVMFSLLVLFTTGGIWLVIERRQGILRRLASSPMSRGAVVLGKWGARLALGMVQIAFVMITATVLFGMRWGPNLSAVVLLLAVCAALATALGILLGNFSRTERQVIGIGVIATNVLAALGGCWWPIEITPRWCQTLALFLPTGWAMDGLHKLISFGAPPATVIPHIAGMALAALLAGYLAARSFRFQ
jgi:ABC-2 type transport system permease protein